MYLTFDDHAAKFAAIANGSVLCCIDFFKIPSSYFVDFKAFRAAATAKFLFRNGKMAVPAAQPAAFSRHQRKDLVFTGFHHVVLALPVYTICL